MQIAARGFHSRFALLAQVVESEPAGSGMVSAKDLVQQSRLMKKQNTTNQYETPGAIGHDVNTLAEGARALWLATSEVADEKSDAGPRATRRCA
jgi:hypothetical protein